MTLQTITCRKTTISLSPVLYEPISRTRRTIPLSPVLHNSPVPCAPLNIMRNPFYADTYNPKERIGWAPIFFTASRPESRGLVMLE